MELRIAHALDSESEFKTIGSRESFRADILVGQRSPIPHSGGATATRQNPNGNGRRRGNQRHGLECPEEKILTLDCNLSLVCDLGLSEGSLLEGPLFQGGFVYKKNNGRISTSKHANGSIGMLESAGTGKGSYDSRHRLDCSSYRTSCPAHFRLCLPRRSSHAHLSTHVLSRYY